MTPDEIRNARFSTGFRGYDTAEVREFLARVAASYGDVTARTFELDRLVIVGPTAAISATDAAGGASESGANGGGVEDAKNIGDRPGVVEANEEAGSAHAAEMLAAARNEAHAIVARANDDAARIILRARAESRGRPSADSAAIMDAAFSESPSDPALAKEQARHMIAEAKAVRERILTDLAKRRKVAHIQLEQLRVAKDKLQESLREARRVVEDTSRDLSTSEVEARLAAETAGRRVAAEPESTVAELEAELFGATHLRPRGDAIAESGFVEPAAADLEVVGVEVADVEVSEVSEVAQVVGVEVADVEVAEVSEVATDESGLEVVELATAEEAASVADVDAPEPAPTPAQRQRANVDELFARLRAEREQAVVSAREVLGTGRAKHPKATASSPSADPAAEGSDGGAGNGEAAGAAASGDGPSAREAARANVALLDLDQVVIIDLERYGNDGQGGRRRAEIDLTSPETRGEVFRPAVGDAVGSSADEVIDLEDDRFEYVRGPLQSQLVRAIKRYLQDEQSTALAVLRTARGRVDLDTLLGAPDVHRVRVFNAVSPFFVDSYRAGLNPIADVADLAVLAAAEPWVRDVADAVQSAVRGALSIGIDAVAAPETDRSQLVDAIGTCYRSWTTDRIAGLSAWQLLEAYRAGRTH